MSTRAAVCEREGELRAALLVLLAPATPHWTSILVAQNPILINKYMYKMGPFYSTLSSTFLIISLGGDRNKKKYSGTFLNSWDHALSNGMVTVK